MGLTADRPPVEPRDLRRRGRIFAPPLPVRGARYKARARFGEDERHALACAVLALDDWLHSFCDDPEMRRWASLGFLERTRWRMAHRTHDGVLSEVAHRLAPWGDLLREVDADG